MSALQRTQESGQPTVALATVGCRLNQAETDAVQEAFAVAGYRVVPFEEGADVYYLNTCTVTGRADRSSRQWIHRARRANPNAVVIVAGCFANRAAEELAQAGEVDLLLGQREKMYPLRYLADPFRRPEQPRIVAGEDDASIPASVGVRVTGRSRAFLKVQDGCDRSCSYCAVAPARGPSISAAAVEVHEALRRIVDAGYEEVVFTGVDISDWHENGKNGVNSELDFVSLLQFASDAGLPRIRISSLEPWMLTPERIGRMAACSAWCEHLHLALQSGDPAVLRRMNRELDLGLLREAMRELIRLRPEATIGADLIAGFPGETETAFANTCSLPDEGWIHYFHVFPFSPRPGTAAAMMKNQLEPERIHQRAALLRKLSQELKKRKLISTIGKINELLVEQDKRSGYTRNYLRTALHRDASRGSRRRVPVRITGVDTATLTLEAEETR